MAGKEASPHAAPTPDRKSKLTRSSAYQSNTTRGYRAGSWQAHHILCEASVGARSFKPADKEFAEQCLWITDWDLNAKVNMVGMPIRSDFTSNNGDIRDTTTGLPINICSHANDHNITNGYTDECTQHLKVKVWDTIKKSGQDHTTEAASIKALLETASTHFSGELTARALREGGTLLMWSKRHDKAYEHKWYYPFSMAMDSEVIPRLPGAKSLVGAFGDIFKRIK